MKLYKEKLDEEDTYDKNSGKNKQIYQKVNIKIII